MTESVRLYVRLPLSLHHRLNAAADERVVSKTLLVRTAIEYYLDNLPDYGTVAALRSSAVYEKPSRRDRLATWWRGSR